VRDGDRWTVLEKDGFGADVGNLREVLLAIADARKLEEKTSNPERYSQLGLDGPTAGSGSQIDISGTDFAYAMIVGNVAQSKNRYVRMVDSDQSWLIDKNPELPSSGAGWLAADLLDIDASSVRSVTVQHADGESIKLAKALAADSNYVVEDIPDGRELSYATVANGIAGVLKGLRLEDVRRAKSGEPVSTAEFTTFDGMIIRVHRFLDPVPDADDADAEYWFAIDAQYIAPIVADETAQVAVATASEEVAIDDTSDEASGESTTAESNGDTAETAVATINSRHGAWQYKVPEYKANLLARRWADILKAQE
jgi:hypothetical protein